MRQLHVIAVVLAFAAAARADTKYVTGAADATLCRAWKHGCVAIAGGAPSPRSDEALVWTGRELFVWGGHAADGTQLTDGAIFDPVANRWRPISRKAAPSPAGHPLVVWTGNRVFVWGAGGGALYDPAADRWTPIAAGGPKPTGAMAWVLGGMVLVYPPGASWPLPLLGPGVRYDPKTDRWDAIAAWPLARRSFAATAIGGGKLFAWGGTKDGGPTAFGDGALYDPVANTWKVIAARNAPSRRYGSVAYYNGSEFVVAGGTRSAEDYGKDISRQRIADSDAARYDPVHDTWLAGAGTRDREQLATLPVSFDYQYHYRLGPDRERFYGYGYPGFYTVPDRTDRAPADLRVFAYGQSDALPVARGAGWIVVARDLALNPMYRRSDASGAFTAYPPVSDGKRTFRVVWTGTRIIAWGGQREIARRTYQCPTHCPRGAPCAVPPPCVDITYAYQNDGVLLTP